MIYTGASNGAESYYRGMKVMPSTTDGFSEATWKGLTDPDGNLADNLKNAIGNTEFLDNLITEAGYWYNSSELGYYNDRRQQAAAVQSYVLELIKEFEYRSMPQFSAIAENSLETIQFYLGNHWSDEDQAIRIAQGMKPYSWPSFLPLVNNFLGELVAQQSDYRVVPRNQRSEARVEVANKMLRWVAQANRLNAVKLDTSRDSVLYGYSVTSTAMDPMDPMGNIQVRRARPEEFMFDLNSPTDSTFANVKYVWRGYWRDRVQLSNEYPEWRKEILRPSGLILNTTGYEMGYSMIRPKVHSPTAQNRMAYSYDPQFEMMYGRLLFVREFYVRRWVDRIVVTDPFAAKTYICKTPSEAAEQQAILERYYAQTALWGQMSEQLRNRMFSGRPKMVEVIDQFILVGDQVVRVNSDDEGGVPYVFCCPMFYDGHLTAHFEQAKGPQRWEDRLMADIDDLQAGAKGGNVVNIAHLKNPNTSVEEIRQTIRERNWTLVVDEQDPEFKSSEVVTPVFNPQNASVLPPLLEYVKQINVQAYGGPNAQGLSAFAGQTGKSVEDLRAAGSVQTKSLIQKLADSDRLLGQRLLYLLQFLHPAVQMRNYDEDLSPVFFSLLDEGIESLADYSFDVEVKQVLASPTERQARIRRMLDILGYDPSLIEGLMPFILKNADIDFTERQNIEQWIANRAKQTAAQAQEAASLTRMKIENEIRVAQGQLMIKGELAENEKLNLPKFNVQIKGSSDPITFADVLNWARINVQDFGEAHPLMVMAGQAVEGIMRQRSLDVQQTHEAALRPEYEKKAIENKIAVKEGHQTAKDASNRAMREVRSGNSE